MIDSVGDFKMAFSLMVVVLYHLPERHLLQEGYRIVRYMLRRVSIKCLSQLKGIMAQQFHGLNRKEWEFNGS